MRSSIFLLACASAFSVWAQDATVTGKITGAGSTEGLVGVTIVYAPGKGVVSDLDGNYVLTIPAGEHSIVFSSIGYQTAREEVTLQAGEQRTVNIALTEAAVQLDMVVISAGKFEQRVGEVTQSLSVLRPELVRNKNSFSLGEALDQVPGVVIMDEEPQIRAGSGFSYGAGSRVQVLVDDIPILSGDIGRPNWTFLPIENLEQVEVIKGASSVLYGSAALSGVINVRTAYPRAEPRTRIITFAGIYDSPANAKARWWGDNSPMFGGANFSHSQRFGKLDLVLGGNAFSDNGYVGPEPLPADTIAADPLRTGPGGYENRIRFNVGTRWHNGKVKGLSYGINANAMKSRSTSVFIWNDIDSGLYRPKPGTVTRTRGAQYYIDPFVDYLSKAGTRHTLRMRYHQQDFDNDNDQSNSNQVLHGEYQVQHNLDLFGETVFTAGLVWRKVTSQAALYSGDADGDGRNDAINTAAYLQLDKKLLDKLALSAGLRFERFTVNDQEAERPVFRAGATYQVLRATYLRASYGQGFRFPTIGERFISTSVGALAIFPNADLLPEQSWNVEGGVKQGFKIGGFVGYLDAVVFQQDYQNYVEFTFGQWGPPPYNASNLYGYGFKSVNTGGARVSGYEFELAGKGKIGAVQLSALMGYTHTTPVSTTPDQVYATSPNPASPIPPSTYANTSYDTTGNILKFRIQRLFRADVQAEYKRFFIGGSVRYNSHVRNIDKAFITLDDLNGILDTGVREWMETHKTGDTIVDARIGTTFMENKVRVAFIVNNLTNHTYSLRPLSIEAPRSMQVQLSMTL
ncbi:MAG: TonB-dependent receptor [Flavobacteriales bacterium]|nr:TonB-dependent receptor [Flavobacteriales bacterium]